MFPRDDIGQNPFTNYDFYKGYDGDLDTPPDDDIVADDWGVDPDYLYDNLTGK